MDDKKIIRQALIRFLLQLKLAGSNPAMEERVRLILTNFK